MFQTCLQPVSWSSPARRSVRSASVPQFPPSKRLGWRGGFSSAFFPLHFFSCGFVPSLWEDFVHNMPVCVTCPSAARTGMAEGHIPSQLAFTFETNFVRFHRICNRLEHFKLRSTVVTSCWAPSPMHCSGALCSESLIMHLLPMVCCREAFPISAVLLTPERGCVRASQRWFAIWKRSKCQLLWTHPSAAIPTCVYRPPRTPDPEAEWDRKGLGGIRPPLEELNAEAAAVNTSGLLDEIQDLPNTNV